MQIEYNQSNVFLRDMKIVLLHRVMMYYPKSNTSVFMLYGIVKETPAEITNLIFAEVRLFIYVVYSAADKLWLLRRSAEE